MFRLHHFFVLVVAVGLTASCGKDDPSKNNSANNDTPNNATQNNATNNTTPANNTSGANNTTGTNNTSGTNNTAGTNGTTGTNNTAGTNNTTGTTGTNNTSGLMCQNANSECFSNDDCPAPQRCEGQGMATTNALTGCCEPGERGVKILGEMCASENDCASGICISRNDDPAICSKVCEAATDCPDFLECHPVLGLCVTPNP